MSHFSVLVVGDNIEEALAPFDENIEMPEYKQGVVSEEEKIRFIQHYIGVGENGKEISEEDAKALIETDFEELYEGNGDSWNGGGWKKHSDGTWWEYSTYNPNSKWDWFQIGGRFAGKLLLKSDVPQTSRHETPNFSWGWSDEAKAKVLSNDRLVDSAKVGEIDWEEMNRRTLERMNSTYDKFEATMADPEKAKKCHPYFEFGLDAVEITKEEFEANKDNPIYYWNDRTQKHYRYQNREEYLGTGKFSTFALLMDGDWYERGEMGWWGMATNEKEADKWETEFEDTIQRLDPDTTITVVDCHI